MNTFLPIAICTLFTGCGPYVCTAQQVFSVNVQIYDDAGRVIEDAAPTFSVDGGEEAPCENDSTGGYNCGEDQEGVVTVYVSIDGFEDAEESVTVEGDKCHVTTESMEIDLVASSSDEE